MTRIVNGTRVRVDAWAIEELNLGDRVLVACHVTEVRQERVDVAGFNGGAEYVESLPGERSVTVEADDVLVGAWKVERP